MRGCLYLQSSDLLDEYLSNPLEPPFDFPTLCLCVFVEGLTESQSTLEFLNGEFSRSSRERTRFNRCLTAFACDDKKPVAPMDIHVFLDPVRCTKVVERRFSVRGAVRVNDVGT